MEVRDQLKNAGLVATKQRVVLLSLLHKAKRPLSVEELLQNIGRSMNMTTVYRALDQLVNARLARKVQLGDNHARYESVGKHHHHVVCRSCGTIAEVAGCLPDSFFAHIKRSQKQFATIEDHALEFFGVCVRCA